MSDTIYNARQYVRFTADEFISIIISSLVIALIFSLRDLLFVRYGDAASIQSAGLLFIFLLFIFLVTIWVCKIVAIRMGHVITYRAHIPGLILGLAISGVSLGYLPIFLPGGFSFDQPERLVVGKWRGVHKGWEVGVIAASFSLIMLLFVIIFSPLYLATHTTNDTEIYGIMLVVCCLTAIYACIPAPFLQSKNSGSAKDPFRHMRGATFGLDVLYASRIWYVIMCAAVLFFSLLTLLLTILDVRVGIFIYVFALFFSSACFWIYLQFFKH